MTATRRDFLKTSGALVVGLTVAGDIVLDAQGTGAGPYPDLDYKQLDSWIVIRPDNTATFFVGKTDLGQGTGTAFRQIMADELDMPYDKTTCVMGITDVTVDQGGSGGSDALQTDGYPMRRVAAEARRVLLEMAAARLGVPVAQLTVSDGVVSVDGRSSKRVTYGELIGGRKFNTTLTGSNINATTGQARLKDVNQFKIVGQSPQRYDIPAKVDGSLKWAVDVKVPGMLPRAQREATGCGRQAREHRRILGEERARPGEGREQGQLCGGGLRTREQAIQAARQLKVNWDKPAAAAFPSSEDLYGFMRTAKPTSSTPPSIVGNPDAAMMTAAKVVEAEYEIPFQGHTSIGPAHAMADPSNNQLTIYSNDMKSYGMREGVAQFLQIPKERVRVVWMEGPQAYGRTAADDAGFEAAYLAKELGRPVRVQWMRNEETAWDTKGPAFVVKARGGLDAQGNLIAFDYDARAADFGHLGYNEATRCSLRS
jgi:CO/xanthine dehydrogenase Mo-binding subunit